ncbi:serine/threonine-protein kinase [Mycolicibacterium iranicum]|uniref:non-specific serine/threonine protein kinase n=1 Tax=Mycolicibacterium iranicum TaxID=912594 RepID=A0ABT4HLZ7_MYCIR|nr:serine/threonine-protein kinase [Mycolicibacterium iranicum]MCZ0731248.1 serine/threonine-protein kinase [Mycolicibacterium iranicum]
MTDAGLPLGTMFGRYRLVGLLGRGGMGEVYEAHDTEKNRTVALKILRDQFAHDDSFRARFLRESQAAAVLQEPHVIPIHDWGDVDGNLFIDMRMVDGQTMYELVRRNPLDPERAVKLIEQVAAALDAAHAAGLIHRDVKPQNIIVTAADFVYLVDFGIVETQGDARLTVDGTHIGSLAYMAPERFNESPSTPASDIYSLACVLYEALTSSTPFRSDSIQSLITSHLLSPPPRASAVDARVPQSLDEVIARGMAKHPEDRYASAGAMARAARRALAPNAADADASADTMVAPASRSASVPPTAHSPAGSRPPRRWVIMALAAGAAAITLGSVAFAVGAVVNRTPSQTSSPTTTETPTLAPATRPAYTVAPTTPSSAPPTVTITESAVLPSTPAAPRPRPQPVMVRGIVIGTCDEGGSCGVKQRAEPFIEAPRLYQNDLRDGAIVSATCQTVGDVRSSRGAGASAIWYRLDNGSYVNAVYVALSADGLPLC